MTESILNITLGDLFDIRKETGVQVTVDISNELIEYGIKFDLTYAGYIQSEYYLINDIRANVDKDFVLDHIRRLAKFLVTYVKENQKESMM